MEAARRMFQKIRGQSRVVRRGYFTICVGPQRQRFVLKLEHANHPRFRTLLDDAENEYGSCSSVHHDGPICLPCHVDVFCRTLAEIQTSVPDKRSWARPLFNILTAALKFRINHHS
ncbi:auxin-induced protein X15-like [Prosopis cineraria]|uniref:auxin-induced protein X15-like n=1 Tax=Prosopis cineraria TaxID=364024 RepID=UPI002410AF86|nr:auxin-induced protein X15-like [Prosopis cineraria]